MAQATTRKFPEFRILIGDGESPEEFVAPCGLTSRSFNRTAETNSTNVPDCDDDEAAAWLENDAVSLSWSLAGEGVMAEESFDVWDAWFTSAVAKNVRITLGDRTWEGSAILSGLNLTGARGSRVTLSAEITGDGALVLQSGS